MIFITTYANDLKRKRLYAIIIAVMSVQYIPRHAVPETTDVQTALTVPTELSVERELRVTLGGDYLTQAELNATASGPVAALALLYPGKSSREDRAPYQEAFDNRKVSAARFIGGMVLEASNERYLQGKQLLSTAVNGVSRVMAWIDQKTVFRSGAHRRTHADSVHWTKAITEAHHVIPSPNA